MYRRMGRVVVASIVACSFVHAETPTLEAIRADMESVWTGVTSLSGDVVMRFILPLGDSPLPLTGTGQLHYLREDGKDKYRKTTTARLPEPFATSMSLDVLYDGKTVYTTTELMGQSQHHEGEPSLRQGALPPGGGQLLDTMEEHLTLTVLPESTVGEHAVYVLEGRAKDETMPFSKAVFYIDKKLAIPRKLEIYQPDGEVGITEEITNVKVNSNPDPSLFKPKK